MDGQTGTAPLRDAVEVLHRLGGRPGIWIAGLTAYAGALHLYASPSHLSAYWMFGAFFIGSGLLQIALGVALLRDPRRWLVAVTFVVSLAIVVLYAVSRIKGVPIGPTVGHHGSHRTPEEIGALDLACTAAEVGALLFAVRMLPSSWTEKLLKGCMAAGAVLWIVRVLFAN